MCRRKEYGKEDGKGRRVTRSRGNRFRMRLASTTPNKVMETVNLHVISLPLDNPPRSINPDDIAQLVLHSRDTFPRDMIRGHLCLCPRTLLPEALRMPPQEPNLLPIAGPGGIDPVMRAGGGRAGV